MITNTFIEDTVGFSAHGEFVFTFGNIVIKIEYTIDEDGCVWIADVKYNHTTLIQKLNMLLDGGDDVKFTTMNGNVSFKNNGDNTVVMNLRSNHSYHGFSTEAKCDLHNFVEQFKNSLDDVFQKFQNQ